MAEKKLGAIHYNWPGYDLEGFAQRASEIGYTHCEVRASDIWTDDAVDGAHRRRLGEGLHAEPWPTALKRRTCGLRWTTMA